MKDLRFLKDIIFDLGVILIPSILKEFMLCLVLGKLNWKMTVP